MHSGANDSIVTSLKTWKPAQLLKKLWVETPWMGISDKKDHKYIPFSIICVVKIIYSGVEEEGGKMERKGVRSLLCSADAKKEIKLLLPLIQRHFSSAEI